jgi:hypothetical protein
MNEVLAYYISRWRRTTQYVLKTRRLLLCRPVPTLWWPTDSNCKSKNWCSWVVINCRKLFVRQLLTKFEPFVKFTMPHINARNWAWRSPFVLEWQVTEGRSVNLISSAQFEACWKWEPYFKWPSVSHQPSDWFRIYAIVVMGATRIILLGRAVSIQCLQICLQTSKLFCRILTMFKSFQILLLSGVFPSFLQIWYF